MRYKVRVEFEVDTAEYSDGDVMGLVEAMLNSEADWPQHSIYVEPVLDLEQVRKFLAGIGVQHPDAYPPMWLYAPEATYSPADESSPGYIKFQSGHTDAVADSVQADQFEVWLNQRGFKYHRGYVGENGRASDRRFFLDKAAANAVAQVLEQFDGATE